MIVTETGATTTSQEKEREAVFCGEEGVFDSRILQVPGKLQILWQQHENPANFCCRLKKTYGSPMIELEQPLWSLKPKGLVKLSNKILVKEMRRKKTKCQFFRK